MDDKLPELTKRVPWIDVAEAARLIRPLLKSTFPGVKFSVRIDRYAGGASVSVSWTDGPRESDVEQVTNGFQSRGFDGMIDLSYGIDSWYCPTHGARLSNSCIYDSRSEVITSRCCSQAELVRFGSSHITIKRDLSQAFIDEMLTRVIEEAGMRLDTSIRDPLPSHSQYHRRPYDRVFDAICRLARETAK